MARPLDSTEKSLWGRVIATVKPMHGGKPKPVPVATPAADKAVLAKFLNAKPKPSPADTKAEMGFFYSNPASPISRYSREVVLSEEVPEGWLRSRFGQRVTKSLSGLAKWHEDSFQSDNQPGLSFLSSCQISGGGIKADFIKFNPTSHHEKNYTHSCARRRTHLIH